MDISCREIARATGGTVVSGDPDTIITGVCIDTRNLETGQWFVPLRGENADGHYFVAEALKKGAAGAFYDYPFPPDNLPGVIIKVEDTLEALQNMASYYRQKFAPVVIGVTGSSGKTTTKDLIAQVLGEKMKVLKTEGNYNNHIGLPLTLLNLSEDDEVLILEMAMRGPGEIAHLTRICKPDWGIITNVGEAHVELLGSRENIAAAKGELLDNMEGYGKALLNGDDDYIQELGNKFSGNVYYYGWNPQNNFRAQDYENKGDGVYFSMLFAGGEEERYYLPLPGRHNASNALVALSLGYLLGMSPHEMSFDEDKLDISTGRMQVKVLPEGVKIIDDSYNANPSSMQAALNVLVEMKVEGRRIAVLGDMFELGDYAQEAHVNIGKTIAQSNIDVLITLGEMANYIAEEAHHKKAETYSCENKQEVWQIIQNLSPHRGDCILVKGSRGMKLEEIVQKFEE